MTKRVFIVDDSAFALDVMRTALGEDAISVTCGRDLVDVERPRGGEGQAAVDEEHAAHPLRHRRCGQGGDEGTHRVPGQDNAVESQVVDQCRDVTSVVGQPGRAQRGALCAAAHVRRDHAQAAGEPVGSAPRKDIPDAGMPCVP